MPKASRVGHLRFTFNDTQTPYVLLEATRASVVGSADVTNLTYPVGTIAVDPAAQEICGANPERQDDILGPNPAPSFHGYFCARFDVPFASWGTITNGTQHAGEDAREGVMLSGYASFEPNTKTIDVRVGVSFISVDQARRNIEKEIPDGTGLESTARNTRGEWKEKLDRVQIENADDDTLTVFYTGLFHALQVCHVAWADCLTIELVHAYSILTNKVKTENIIQAMTILFIQANHIPVIPSGYVLTFRNESWDRRLL